jgi:hypothetical protein
VSATPAWGSPPTHCDNPPAPTLAGVGPEVAGVAPNVAGVGPEVAGVGPAVASVGADAGPCRELWSADTDAVAPDAGFLSPDGLPVSSHPPAGVVAPDVAVPEGASGLGGSPREQLRTGVAGAPALRAWCAHGNARLWRRVDARRAASSHSPHHCDKPRVQRLPPSGATMAGVAPDSGGGLPRIRTLTHHDDLLEKSEGLPRDWPLSAPEPPDLTPDLCQRPDGTRR